MANQRITFPSANKQGACPGVLSGDPKISPRGLIVLQEWWGVNQQIQECGKDLCQRGSFVTLIPDLYRGKTTTDNEEAGHFMGNLDWKGAIDDIQGAAKYLLEQGVKKVGVVGFCMGGALSMAAAALIPELSASVVFYGVPSEQLCDVTKISIPLQCHFALQDHTVGFASPNEWKPLKAKIEGKIKTLEVYEYDCNHAFANSISANFHKEFCEQAFSRMFEFFNKHLS